MVPGIRSLAALLLGTASALGQLNLNPTQSTRQLEGVTFQELVFQHGTARVTYEPPSGWSYRGSATTLSLKPPQRSQAEATIQTMPLSRQSSPLTPESLVALKQRAMALVPSGAANVEVVSEEQSPIRIDGRETFEVVLGYVLYGQRFQSSVLFLSLDDAEMLFRLQCPSSDFADFSKLFRGSLSGLQWHRAPR
jgi:hypothetical protein